MRSTDATPAVTRENWRELVKQVPDLPLWRLALLTDRSPGSVYAYSRGANPPDEWIEKVARVLGPYLAERPE